MNSVIRRSVGIAAVIFFAVGSGLCAEVPLRSPWDVHPVTVRHEDYRCPTAPVLPYDIVASDYYSDSKHSVVDEKRKAAYDEVKAQYLQVTHDAEEAADHFQQTGSTQAAACVMKVLEVQAQANAMTGSMSTNQANYMQGWTMGALAITYLKVRTAGPVALGATPEQTAAVQAWMKKVGQQVKDYFQARREKRTNDGQNNHLYWAGFTAMAVGVAVNDRALYDWGVGTYEDGVRLITPDGTLPLEIARGQRALHYHLFALAPLVTMAEIGEANGQDLYAYDHSALHLLVSRSMAGLADNRFFAEKAGAVQDTPEKGGIKSDDVIWVTPYVRRFPDPRISSLLQQGGGKPYDYLGGMPPS